MKMRKHILPLFILFFNLQTTVHAQYDRSNNNDSDKIINAKYRFYTLTRDKDEMTNTDLPFHHITFKDVRYDTTFIAINWQSAGNRSGSTASVNKKFNLDSGLASGLTIYFNRYNTNTSHDTGDELICYIKSFSISAKDTSLQYFNPKEQEARSKDNIVKLGVECYYKKDNGLFPALRVDTVYTYHLTGIRRDFPDIIKDMADLMIQKMKAADIDKIVKRKAYTEPEIEARYNGRFNLPILTATTYQRGIYKTFAEFINNAPSITTFDIKTEKIRVGGEQKTRLLNPYKFEQPRNTAVYLYDANHDIISASTVYGFCDGATCWIQHGAFYYSLIRVCNTFEFLYNYYYTNNNGDTFYTKNIFSLNMDNGNVN